MKRVHIVIRSVGLSSNIVLNKKDLWVMRMGMSALVCSLIWTYLHSSNKRCLVCEWAWKRNPPSDSGGREWTISLHHWAGLCQPHVVHSLPLCLRSPRHHHGNQKSHISSSFLTDWGGIVHSYAGTQTSVWRWFCNNTSPLSHTRRWAKSSPQAEFCEVTVWHWSTTDWHKSV